MQSKLPQWLSRPLHRATFARVDALALHGRPGTSRAMVLGARIAAILFTVWMTSMSTAAYGVATLIVDDDRVQCPGAKFTNIQAAVNAAASGDTISVCPGTYNESTRVTKTLTLLGAQAGHDARTRVVNPATESTILAGASFFRLEADGIVFDGFSVKVVLPDDGEGVGIQTDNNFSGYKIVDNVLDADGTSAIWLGASGAKQSLIRYNLFKGRLGIAADFGEGPIAHNVLIRDNLFDGASLGIFGSQHSDLVITLNKLIKGGGISIVDNAFPNNPPPRTRNVQVTKNQIDSPIQPAIALRRVDTGLVKENRLTKGTRDGISVTGENQSLQLTSNVIDKFVGRGVQVGVPPSGNLPQESTTGLTVNLNEIDENAAGLSLLRSLGNTFSQNSLEDNKGIGINVDFTSAKNLFKANEARGNVQIDCLDVSSGNGTKGTNNIWIGNEGSTSSPAGICVDNP